MLAYFPQIYPGELLYSVLARYHLHVGCMSLGHTAEDLFRRRLTVSVELQGWLGALCERIPPGRGLTPEWLAWECTLYPYYAAFRPRAVAEAALRTLISGSKPSARVQLGVATGAIRTPSYLRFCPACRVEMLQAHGELYWRREHQLPGVLVCPMHGVPLANSSVILNTPLWEFVGADTGNCSAEAVPEPWAADARTIALLQRIARYSAALLTGPRTIDELEGLAKTYRLALLCRGFGRGEHVARKEVATAFAQTLAPVIPLLPGADPRGASVWLQYITCGNNGFCFEPLRHVLLRLFLEETPAVQEPPLPRPIPFGSGPWPCRNPLADHYGQSVVSGLHIQRNGRARFSCSCGFVYTVAVGAESKPHVVNRGFLFDARLRSLAAAGSSLADAARALAVSKHVVQHRAAKLGRVAEPGYRDAIRSRCLAALSERPDLSRTGLLALLKSDYCWLRKNDGEWLSRLLPRNGRWKHRPPPAKPRSHIDWPGLDCKLAAAVTPQARQVKLERPPRRVTLIELERRVTKPRWILDRIKKLPQTAAAVRKAVETTGDFQQRRIAWAVEELHRLQLPVSAWRVSKLAQLPYNLSPRIASALAAVESGAALTRSISPALGNEA